MIVHCYFFLFGTVTQVCDAIEELDGIIQVEWKRTYLNLT